MIKVTYKDNNIYLDKYLLQKDFIVDNEIDLSVLLSSINEVNCSLNKRFKGYKILNLEYKKEDNIFIIDLYNKRLDHKRRDKFYMINTNNKFFISL